VEYFNYYLYLVKRTTFARRPWPVTLVITRCQLLGASTTSSIELLFRLLVYLNCIRGNKLASLMLNLGDLSKKGNSKRY